MDLSLFKTFQFIVITIVILFHSSLIAEQQVTDSNIELLEKYIVTTHYKQEQNEALHVATKIINNRHLYDPTNIAKAYLLMADISLLRGDITKAFQFAQDGLALTIQTLNVRLELLLITAQGYYQQGKFQQVKSVAERILAFVEYEDEKYIIYRLKALAYRAMVYALVTDYPNALTDLRQIDFLLEQDEDSPQPIDLLTIIASAYYYLGDYDTAISIRLKLLNFNYKNADSSMIGEHHYALASAYQQLNRLDDAYNAFWQAKVQAQQSNSPIKSAYALLGLGQVMLMQKNYQEALEYLTKAEQIFNENNLTTAYLSSVIALSKTYLSMKNNEQANYYLIKAEGLMEHVELTSAQIELYQLLSQMYERKNQHKKAWQLLQQYTVLNDEYKIKQHLFLDELFTVKKAHNRNHMATLQLVLKTELQAEYAEKFKQKSKLTNTLILIIIGLISAILFLIFKRRNQEITFGDNGNDNSNYFSDSRDTKQLYQKSYKMARKYNYQLSIGYLLIYNWNDLKYQCNKKELIEVKKTIATVISEYIGEFDQAGLLNEGEYILIFPHQRAEQVKQVVSALNEALKVRFFANLGEIIVNINYAVDTLNAQDIDPFIFLSHLTESIR